MEQVEQQQSFRRPKVGLLITAFTLGILSFTTLFSVEFTAWQLDNKIIHLEREEVKKKQQRQQQQLPLLSVAERDGWEIKSNLITYDNYDDDDNVNHHNSMDSNDNNTTATTTTKITLEDKRYANMDIQLQISRGTISNTFTSHQINQAILQRNQKYQYQLQTFPSPACFPHFNLYTRNGTWSNNTTTKTKTTKFKRILFYHARKAGGSSINKYLVKVAETYGIKLEWMEWRSMEEPGTPHYTTEGEEEEEDTFYVTHIREPIDRSISHFKYNGRWPCKYLMKSNFTPTENNANQLEQWNETGGTAPKSTCHNRDTAFYLGDCAVNCYTQWFGGLNCPHWNVPIEEQYKVAMSKLLKYNLIIVIEKLRDPNYVRAIENFFGVTGILERGSPFCERRSHKVNKDIPLIVKEDTRKRLTELNKVDLKLYHTITDCLDEEDDNRRYEHIPKWDGDRFHIHSFNYTQDRIEKAKAKAQKAMMKGTPLNI